MPLSETYANRIIDHINGNTAMSQPTQWDVALYVSGVEVSGGSYARVNAGSWGAASGRTSSNDTIIQFPTPTADWGLVDSFRIFDQSGAEIGNDS